jgi:hypothetical protein
MSSRTRRWSRPEMKNTTARTTMMKSTAGLVESAAAGQRGSGETTVQECIPYDADTMEEAAWGK